MLGIVGRILLGFVLAMLAAGLTTVAFVITSAELAPLAGDRLAGRLSTAGTLALLAATHSAIFAAPFALIGISVGEWMSLRGAGYYLLLGMLIALGGFAAQYASETGAAASIANNYAFNAFLTSGFVGGLVYWLSSGQFAGRPPIMLPPSAPPRIKVEKAATAASSGASSAAAAGKSDAPGGAPATKGA